MSQGSTATELVASLDRALAGILPLTDILEPFALQSKEDVQRSVQDFAAAAQALQALLLQARAAGGSPLLALRQEERELREELAAKEALLRACAERLADWQARCARVAAELRAAAAL